MKALDALWSFSLSPLTSELMIALVGGGDVMLSCPLPQLHRTRVQSFSVFTPSRLKVAPIPQVFMEVVCPV